MQPAPRPQPPFQEHNLGHSNQNLRKNRYQIVLTLSAFTWFMYPGPNVLSGIVYLCYKSYCSCRNARTSYSTFSFSITPVLIFWAWFMKNTEGARLLSDHGDFLWICSDFKDMNKFFCMFFRILPFHIFSCQWCRSSTRIHSWTIIIFSVY